MLTGVLFLMVAVASQPAHIEVYTDSVIGTVSPCLYGSGDEMNEDFSQDGLESLVSYTGVPLLRMGGLGAEYLDWEANDYNGLWYIDFVDTAIYVDSLSFGIDSLLRFCETVGAEPVLTVNFQINDPGKAARLVEYCNGSATTPMGAVRATRGHPEPYDVEYWCIGNEPDISGILLVLGSYRWTVYRHFGIPFSQWSWRDSSYATPASFSALVDVYIDSMRARSPIPLEIGGLSLAGDLSWIETVVGENNHKMEWMDIHYYPNGSWTADSSLYREWLASPDTGGLSIPQPVEDWYQMVCDTVEEHSGGHDISVYVFEYGSGMILVEDPLWWNYLDGLFAADAIGHFAVAGVPMAAVYSIYEGDPESDEFPLFGRIRGDTLSLRMGAHVLKLYTGFFGETLVNSTSDVFGLNAYASVRNDDTLALIVVNKDLDSAYAATICLHDFTSNGTMEVRDIRRDTTLAAPWNGTRGIVYRGEHSGEPTTFAYTFPKASVSSVLISRQYLGGDDEAAIPQKLWLSQNYPNPFVNATIIRYSLTSPGSVELRVYNLAGQLVRTLVDKDQESGNYSVYWNDKSDHARPLPPGLYFYRLRVGGGFSERKRLILAR